MTETWGMSNFFGLSLFGCQTSPKNVKNGPYIHPSISEISLFCRNTVFWGENASRKKKKAAPQQHLKKAIFHYKTGENEKKGQRRGTSWSRTPHTHIYIYICIYICIPAYMLRSHYFDPH